MGVCPTWNILKIWTSKNAFCIQVAAVDLHAAVLSDTTATSGVSDVDTSPNRDELLMPDKIIN